MPRANRHFLPGLVWHITHRCHERDFLLKFSRDRKRWRYWLFEAKRRYGLCVLNYTVTCNHIHLLVLDRGKNEIARSMQLIAGRVAQEYNQRRRRRGAFWEDRYHATAVETDLHLVRCLTYIDLNMVRAGAVPHPAAWRDGGYGELLSARQRYATLDHEALLCLLEIRDLATLLEWRTQQAEADIADDRLQREPAWTESLAIGSSLFVRNVQTVLGIRASHRTIHEQPVGHLLREPLLSYSAFVV